MGSMDGNLTMFPYFPYGVLNFNYCSGLAWMDVKFEKLAYRLQMFINKKTSRIALEWKPQESPRGYLKFTRQGFIMNEAKNMDIVKNDCSK